MKKIVCPLAMVPVGQEVELDRIQGGEAVVHRLTALGLTPGVKIRIVQDGGGPLVLCVRESRIALGRRMAHRIMVRFSFDEDAIKSKGHVGRGGWRHHFRRHSHRKNKFR